MYKTLKVGYFVKMYPRISETFILNEILEMERRGVEVTIFSLKKPDEGKFHPQTSTVKAQVIYLDSRHLKTGWPLLVESWPTLAPYNARLWGLLEELIATHNPKYLENFFAAVTASAISVELGLDHLHAHFHLSVFAGIRLLFPRWWTTLQWLRRQRRVGRRSGRLVMLGF